MVEIFKDFLPDFHFKDIDRLFMTEILPWFFQDTVVTGHKHFMFSHVFMNDGNVVNPRLFEPVRGMIPELLKKTKFIGVTRIRAVLYTNQGREIIHPTHTDIPLDSEFSDKFKTAVYHVNSCNGKTVIGDQEIISQANQMILFDNIPHYGTTQTDTDIRVVLNFNLRIE
ncbi:MAG: hypothetical protein HKN36_06435 [Hellea sp.]|nr:hypothetical protein [Hellea sp.]